MQIDLRPVESGDRDFLVRVYAGTRQEEMALVPWSDEEKRQFVESQFDAQSADYEARFAGSEHSVILADGIPVGRMWVGKWDDEFRLLDIAILPERRNKGIGRRLVESLIEEAAAAGAPLRHSVYKTNAEALRFYERLGFSVVQDFETYVLMEWST